MSSSVRKVFPLSAIPQVAASTVPVAARRVVGVKKPQATAADVFGELPNAHEYPTVDLLALVKTAGAHATITVTIEGSQDGVTWYGLALGLPAFAHAGFTVNGNGIAGAVALFLAGASIRVPGNWPYYRLGIAGDNVAANGTAEIGLRVSRDL